MTIEDIGKEYALVNLDTGDLKTISKRTDPDVQTRPPWNWVPVVRNDPPSHNAATHHPPNALNAYSDPNYVFGWVDNPKTRAELDADQAEADAAAQRQADAEAETQAKEDRLVSMETRLSSLETP